MFFLHEITEGRLNKREGAEEEFKNLANDNDYVALKRAAEDTRMETQRNDVKNLFEVVQQKITDDDEPLGRRRVYKYWELFGS